MVSPIFLQKIVFPFICRGENKIEFATSEDRQGALVNINLNATGFSSTTSMIGGIVGENCGKLSNAYVTGSINAPDVDNVGGAVGYGEYLEAGIYKRNTGTNEIRYEISDRYRWPFGKKKDYPFFLSVG